MLRVGFEPTIPAFERAKTVHVLDRAATVIGEAYICICIVEIQYSTVFRDVTASVKSGILMLTFRMNVRLPFSWLETRNINIVS
jgi:hypothetical protein